MNGGAWMAGVVPMAAASFLSSGCAHAAAASPSPQARGPHEPESVAIEYEVTRKGPVVGAGPDDGVILRGRTSIDSRGDAEIKHAARDREELRLGAHQRDDGTFDVEVRYQEVSPEGQIAWQPVLRLARGAQGSADVAGAGWARSIRVKLE